MRFIKALWGEFLAVLPRLSGWTLIAILLTVAIGLLNPSLLAVTLYKVSLIPVGAVLGYWIDRAVSRYARPEFYLYEGTFDDGTPPCVADSELFRVAQYRRTAIIVACIIGICLGA